MAKQKKYDRTFLKELMVLHCTVIYFEPPSLEIGLKNSLLYLFCELSPFKSGRYALRQTKSYCNSKQWYKEHNSTKCRNVEERISMQSSFFPCKRYLFDGMALLDKKKKKMGTQKRAVHKIRWQWRQ